VQFHLDKAKILSKADLKEFLEGLKNFGNLIAPKRKGEKFVFDRVENVDEVELNYTRTSSRQRNFSFPTEGRDFPTT
jgi:sulfhydrogenase subunit beta (sulfur reductase)